MDNDLKDYISKSVNSFTFKDFDYGKKWFSVLQKTNWNNIDWICKNIKYYRAKSFIINDSYPHSPFSNLFKFEFITRFFKRPLYSIMWYFFERMPYNIMHRKILKDRLDFFLLEGGKDLIEKFPISQQPGAPFFFRYKNLDININALMHYNHLNKIRKYLYKQIINNEIKIVLDLGGSHGFFNALFKTIYPQTTQIIIDFPQQLILAYYFFKTQFPNAKILDFRNFDRCNFSHHDLSKYDFVLIPNDKFNLLKKNSIDLTCNFMSLGEMPRKYFEKYLNADFYKTSKYYCLCNRYESSPLFDPIMGYDNDITILDYDINKKNTIYFGTYSTPHAYYVKRTFLLFGSKGILSSYLFFTILKNVTLKK